MMPCSRILLIDDDREIVRALSVRLRALGYELSVAYDGQEGLEQIRAQPPDLVLLDVRMPRMDGMQVLKQIRETKETRGIPVIMLSASLLSHNHALDLGARYFLEKPCESGTLRAAIESVIEERPVDRAVARQGGAAQ